MPVYSKGRVWGDEIYFKIPESLSPVSKTKDVEVGDIAYWEEGRSLCLFFGPTPISKDGSPEPYIAVTKIGRFVADSQSMRILRSFKEGQEIRLQRQEVG